MALILDYTDPDTGAKGNYFRILRIVGICAPNEPDPRWEVWVGFYSSQDIRARSSNPLRQYQINIPFSALAVDPRSGAMPGFYEALKNYAPFAGRAVVDVVDDSLDLDLDVAKAMKNTEINSARLAANTGSFAYLGKQIACDTLSRGDIDGANGYISLMGAFPDSWIGAWKAVDNSFISITTIDEWKSLYAAMVDQGAKNFAHSEALKKMVADATTTDQVMAVSWSIDTSATPATDGGPIA